MERMTIRKYDFVMFQKDGKIISPMDMTSQDVKQALEWLADLEDAVESGVIGVGENAKV